jgi:hypothetical protein
LLNSNIILYECSMVLSLKYMCDILELVGI